MAAAVRSALQLVNMEDFMYRATHTLSGGQRQRVAIAGGHDTLVRIGNAGRPTPAHKHTTVANIAVTARPLSHELVQL